MDGQTNMTGIGWIDNHPLMIAIGVPLHKSAPQGDPIDDNEIFEDIETEMMKRGTLNHSSIRWDWVCEQCATLLQKETKDFRLLLFILQSLPNIRSCPAPLTFGAVICARFFSLWGETAYPVQKRSLPIMRKMTDMFDSLGELALKTGISSELQDATITALRQLPPTLNVYDAELGLKLNNLAKKVEASTLEDDPSGLPSLEKTLLEPAHSKPIVQTVPSQSSGKTSALELHPENIVLDSKNERALKQSLTVVADFILEIDIANPLSYRLRRFATWYGVNTAPPIKRDNKTVIQPVSENAADAYRIAAERGQTDIEIAQKLERSCHIQPFWIEGQYLAYKLALICDRKKAADAILDETNRFVAGADWLTKLQFSDGTAFIPDDVASWLGNAKTGSAMSSLSTNQDSGIVDHDMQSVVRNAREQANQGRMQEAIDMLENAKTNAVNPRGATIWELVVMECLSDWGMKQLVSAQAARLEKDIREKTVPEWEPDLIQRINRLIKG